MDFLLRRNRDYLAIEAKSSKRASKASFTGLRAISELRGLVRRILVYGGTQEAKTADGIEVWPVSVFLSRIANGKLWP